MNSYSVTLAISGIQDFTVTAGSEEEAIADAKAQLFLMPPDSFGLDIDAVSVDLEEEDI